MPGNVAATLPAELLVDIVSRTIDKTSCWPFDLCSIRFSVRHELCPRDHGPWAPPWDKEWTSDWRRIDKYILVNRWWFHVLRSTMWRRAFELSDTNTSLAPSLREVCNKVEQEGTCEAVRALRYRPIGYYSYWETIDWSDALASQERHIAHFGTLRRALALFPNIRDLGLSGVDFEPHLDAASLGASSRLRTFDFGDVSLNKCFRLLTTLLPSLTNLEHLNIAEVQGPPPTGMGLGDDGETDSWPSHLPRPSYQLKFLSVRQVSHPRLVAWLGGDSRRSLRHLILTMPSHLERFVSGDFAGMFPTNSTKAFPLALDRLDIEGATNCPLLRDFLGKWVCHDTLGALGLWASDGNERNSMLVNLDIAASLFPRMHRLIVHDEGASTLQLLDCIQAGQWPQLEELEITRLPIGPGLPRSKVKYLGEACQRRHIEFEWRPSDKDSPEDWDDNTEDWPEDWILG